MVAKTGAGKSAQEYYGRGYAEDIDDLQSQIWNETHQQKWRKKEQKRNKAVTIHHALSLQSAIWYLSQLLL